MPNSKTDIVIGNLRELTDVRLSLHEKQIAHLGELAELLCDEAGEDEIFFRDEAFAARYRELTGLPSLSSVSPLNAHRVAVAEGILSAASRAMLLKRLTDSLGIRGLQAAGTFFDEPPGEENETISYMKSSYADEAYTCFSTLLREPKVLYGHDFAEICENVYYGRCAYCILPIENSTDGRLAGFRGLIMKYGLRITKICRVETGGEGRTVFALLKKTLTLPIGDEAPMFEFRVTAENGLLPLLCAAEVCGMQPLFVHSVPGESRSYDMIMTIDDEGFCGFLSFLHLEYPAFIPTGMYGEIRD
ncbi:MAG: hypothetical protein E7618_01945 [Ruminococcaceae bacterium]|nr:hypothetical protein [Oscillospiraceae bacterium]